MDRIKKEKLNGIISNLVCNVNHSRFQMPLWQLAFEIRTSWKERDNWEKCCLEEREKAILLHQNIAELKKELSE